MQSLANSGSPRDLEVAGEPGKLSDADAREIVSRTLGVKPSLLTADREGIYLVNDDPKHARVAYRVTMKAGSGMDDIVTYVDAQTRQVMAVK